VIWRAGTCLLTADGDAFALVDASGAVVRWYGSRSYSDEDDLWTWDHCVDGDRFYRRTSIEHAGQPVRCDRELVLDGLVPADEAATRAVVAAALAADAAMRHEARLREDHAAEARVAAIAGARDAHDHGDEFERARHALIARVRAYDDGLAAALLRTLIALAGAPAAPAALAAYARGCRHACFDRGIPDDAVAAPSVGDAAPAPLLAEQVAALARTLERAADDQEAVDARHNASAYRRAAERIAQAAQLLAGRG
jgi:hypothetical protein